MRVAALILAAVMAASPVLADAPKRVVTVGGSVTEIVYALGAGDSVVGSDTTSYFPPAAGKTPKVGYQRALSAEGVLSLAPDIVLLTEEAGPPPVLAQLQSTGLALRYLKAGRTLADIEENIRAVGSALDRGREAAALIVRLNDAGAELNQAVSGIGRSKRVLFILQYGGGTPMVAGRNTAADSMITLAGAKNAVDGYTGYKPLTPESAVAAAPDIILITTQGLEIIGGIDALKKLPGISLTQAMRKGRVVDMESQQMLGFGPRTVDAALELHRLFAGHE